MEGVYGRLDMERARFANFPAALAARMAIVHLSPYRHKPGSSAWVAVEEGLFKAFDSAGAAGAASLFDKLGYADYYMKSIRSGNRWEQAMAAERLGHMRCEKALPLIVEAFESPNTDLRLMAIHAAGRIGDPSVLPALVRIMKSVVLTGEDVSKKVLASSILSFGASASRPLVDELSCPDWRVRAVCLNLLGEIGGAGLGPLFMRMLDDPEQDVRAKAARGLGRIRCAEAALKLEECLNDRHWVVRLHASRALGLIREQRSEPALVARLVDRNWQVRRAVSEALARMGQRTSSFKVFIDSPDQYARDQALDELSRSSVAAALLSMLPGGASSHLVLKEVSPTADNGGVRTEVLVDMVMFLSTLDEQTLAMALTAMRLAIDLNGPYGAMPDGESIRELGSRGRGQIFAE
jgi:HEAT repeat protein